MPLGNWGRLGSEKSGDRSRGHKVYLPCSGYGRKGEGLLLLYLASGCQSLIGLYLFNALSYKYFLSMSLHL
jgi:hypothetical protein